MNCEETNWSGAFYFIQGADTQLGLIDEWMKEDKRGWEKEVELFKLTISKINLMVPKPKFFVVCGDLVNAFPGDNEKPLQEKDFKLVLSELDPDIKPVCVCGNHDIGNIPTPEAVANYKKSFGDDYFSFWVGGCLFVVLNSQYYKDSSLTEKEAILQDKWLDELLNSVTNCKSRPKHIIVFMHIPPFIYTIDEPDQYFNLPTSSRMPLLEKFEKHGIPKIFCGHLHRNAGGFAFSNKLEVIVTGAIGLQLDENWVGTYGTSESGIRVVCINESTIKHQYYSIDSIPKEIQI